MAEVETAMAELEQVAPVVFVDGQDLFWWGARTFDAIDAPYGGFRRVVRGFDPAHRGVAETPYTLSLDAGCGDDRFGRAHPEHHEHEAELAQLSAHALAVVQGEARDLHRATQLGDPRNHRFQIAPSHRAFRPLRLAAHLARPQRAVAVEAQVQLHLRTQFPAQPELPVAARVVAQLGVALIGGATTARTALPGRRTARRTAPARVR